MVAIFSQKSGSLIRCHHQVFNIVKDLTCDRLYKCPQGSFILTKDWDSSTRRSTQDRMESAEIVGRTLPLTNKL